ncbi:hypothetical protein ACFW81_23895 [Streptomyces angustmyceticus]|uniref:hypothetical protein n=1 Tax=Streptomyces angustmyceticus TaxID=285578 RepID=UPI00367B04A8
MSAAPQPGDWHETLVDLLTLDCGIPEDRARRFLARHAEEARATSEPDPDLVTQLAEAEALAGRWEEKYFEQAEKRSEALAAIDRVQRASTTPRVVPGDLAERGPASNRDSFLQGYELGVLATKAALRSPTEPTSFPPTEEQS